MNRKTAMSAMGYAIATIIILGVVMIISAPMLLDNVKKENPKPVQDEVRDESYSELRELENRLTSRIENLERNNSEVQQASDISNKYVCTIEGNLDENGDVVSVDSPNRTEKFVFVCEYRK